MPNWGIRLPQSKYFRTCLGLIFALLIIYLGSKVSFIFNPLVLLFNIMIIPVMLAGFMYYLLRPIVNFWKSTAGRGHCRSC